MSTVSSKVPSRDSSFYIQRHLWVGWWSLLCFLILGVVLEAFHALKIGWYLNVAHETRRLMWVLAHTHGTLVALVNLAFGATLYIAPETAQGWRRLVSGCLIGAAILLPGGFFLGGIFLHGGDPGLGVTLVPIGAGMLVLAVFLIARGQTPITPPTIADAASELPPPGRKRGRQSSSAEASH